MGDLSGPVRTYLDGVTPEKRRRDAEKLLELMARVTGEPPRVGGSIIGFGQYHYKYQSGREGDVAAAGFAPRKAATTIYLLDGVGRYEEQLERQDRIPPASDAITSRISTGLIFRSWKISSPSHFATSLATPIRSERAKELRHRHLKPDRLSATWCGADPAHRASVNTDGDRDCIVHLVRLDQLPTWVGLKIQTEHSAVHASREPKPLPVEVSLVEIGPTG